MKYLFEKKSIYSVIMIDIYFILSVCLLIELFFRQKNMRNKILGFFFLLLLLLLLLFLSKEKKNELVHVCMCTCIIKFFV